MTALAALVLYPAGIRAADTDVVINEIMYHPDTECEEEEFIELYNRNATDPVNLSGWRFSEGVYYTFPAGTILPPHGYVVVCGNLTAFNSYYCTPTITLLGPWTGHLTNNGEDIVLVNSVGTRIDRVRYNDKRPWPISPDGAGPSLELVNPNDDNTSAGTWRAATSNWLATIWRRYEVTGVPTSTTVYFYLDSAGECLIDDVRLEAVSSPGVSYLLNGGFETASPLQWSAAGTHSGSVRVTSDAHSGVACMKLVAAGAGGEYSGQVWQASQPITLNGPQYTLSFWAKGARPGVVLRAGMKSPRSTWAPTNSQPIGTAAGSQSYNAGTQTYTVLGSGADIEGGTDHFYYSYATLNGNGSLEALVSRVNNPGGSNSALGGIMIRETLANNSNYACVYLNWSGAVNFRYRAVAGTTPVFAGPNTGGAAVLRLTRQGNTFTAEADTGGGFVQVGSPVTIAMASSIQVGFAVCSYAHPNQATYNFTQPVNSVGAGFFTEVSVPSFYATPGSQNSCYDTNTPPYIRNVDSSPDPLTSANQIVIRARITDPDGINVAMLFYQTVRPGRYIRIGDPDYVTSWTLVQMVAASTPTYYVAPIPAQPNRTLLRFRITTQDGSGRLTTAPYPDDPQPNYARYVYDGVPTYTASPQPGVKPVRDHTVLTKVPVLQLIANAADVNQAQTVSIGDRIERRQFKWYGTVVFNGNVYDHIRYRMRGGTWRYQYNKRMWKFRFNRGHYLDFIHNDGEPYAEELQTLNLNACIQPPGNVPSWLSWSTTRVPFPGRGYASASQRGEAGIVEKICFWLWHRVGAIAPDTTWVHFRIVDNASETGADQYTGDFFGLYMALQGMDESVLKTSDRQPGNFYKIDSFGYLPGGPPWFVKVHDCAQPDAQTDITEFRRQYGPKAGYPTPTKQWWEDNFDLDAYYSARTVVDFAHHGDLYNTTWWDGVRTGKNYYFYHNPVTNKWEIVYWDVDLTFGTDHSGSPRPLFGGCAESSPFTSRTIQNAAFPEFQLAYKNRLREAIQLAFCEEKLFPQLDQWRNLLIEIAEADRDRWDWVPATAPSDQFREWRGHFTSFLNVYPSATTAPLDVRLGDIKYWIRNRLNWLTNPPRNWWMESSTPWLPVTCWDPDIPSTPTLTAPGPTVAFSSQTMILLTSSAFSDPNGNPHAASKWIATRVGGNELKPEWSSGITTTGLTSMVIPANSLTSGTYWLRVRHMDNTNRWSWWSKIPVTIGISNSKVGSVVINSGAVWTISTGVNLLLATTSTLPVTQMQFSNDAVTWSAWEPYGATKAWTVTAGDGTKIVYFRFKDSVGMVSAVFGDTITLETTAPTGSIVINSGAAATSQTAVTLSLYAADTVSGVTQMRFSNNGSSYGAWEPYGTAKAWNLTATPDGTKTVYVQYRDGAGNVSTRTDTITLDTAPPSGSIAINGGAAQTTSTLVTLTLSATDSLTGVSRMRFSNTGTSWGAWETYATQRTGWSLTPGNGTKTVYVQFRDGLGNVSGSFSDTIILNRATRAENWPRYK
jgi:hypothetical protein